MSRANSAESTNVSLPDDARWGIRLDRELQPDASVQLQIQHIPKHTAVQFCMAVRRLTPCRNPQRTWFNW